MSAVPAMSLFTVSQYFSTSNGNTKECFVQTKGRGGRASSSTPRAPSIHWAEDMDGAVDLGLMEQIKRAKEMGYPDSAVLEALKRNCDRTSDSSPENGDSPGRYKRFSDMNAMLDMLNKTSDDSRKKETLSHSSSADSNYSPSCDRSSLSGRDSSSQSLDEKHPGPSRLSVYKESRKDRLSEAPRSASVSRSTSFNFDTRAASRKALQSSSQPPSKDIDRLVDALEKEHKRNISNQMEQIELLMQKVDEMKREHAELKQKLDEKILSELQLEKQLKDQKELEEYRKSELIDRNERLQGELSAACEERDQMRTEMQDHIHRETELQAVIEDKEKMIQEMVENAGSISRRSSVFRPHCIICLEKWPNIVFSKCMHLAVCEECYIMAAANPSAPLKTCPTCREPITGSLKVYM